MMIGSVDQWEKKRQSMHPVIRRAIDYLAQLDEGILEEEGVQPIWGEDMYARLMAVKTKRKEEQPAEKHEHYFDIHYVIQGEELIGWKRDDGMCSPVQPYDEKGDYALYGELSGEMMIKLTPGMFMVLPPEDIHRPCLTESTASDLKKVVIKVKASLF
ncbi:YhcH/YjgK/YiaL family protein [Paenibacillus sp. PR3]|uniref:YhcH/YjgK/YiaL family protein n=1 Tax=Paenibacillus terricola TaxID=2763503 RepID=A0ABR8N2S2_9BACL|nr:YhcH/YjgK/YiaL family protein [Paenibacillus terricola]MBD3922453.1 YhcH/YjgK/YiaL family protein [Paenibacillus terricola]